MRPDTAATIRARLILAMEQRAARLTGEARRAMDARLTRLREFDADAREPASGPDATAPRQRPLRELADRLARAASPERAAYPELPALADFRRLWSTLRADSRLEASIAHTPGDAGPLNSTALASRAIALMRELSPGYLRSFLAYLDDLAWLEQLGGAGTATASGTVATKRRGRRKPRA